MINLTMLIVILVAVNQFRIDFLIYDFCMLVYVTLYKGMNA